MAGYDPQARRSRPAPPADSPVDGLLDVNGDGAEPPVHPDEEATPAPVDAPAEESDQGPADEPVVELADDGSGEGLLPFETPPVEMTDERADLLHRVGVLAAVAALVLVLVAVRRRRRDG